jgi:predicted nucleotidyltransferase
MAVTRETILMRLAENREALRRMGVRRIGLFGSAARGEEARDLDFLLELDEKTFDAYMDVKLFLEELFGCPVDLVLADALKPALREGILRETVYAPGS